MAKNRIAESVDPTITVGWEEGFPDDYLSLYCPIPSDPMAPAEEPLEERSRKPLWAAVAKLRESEIARLERRVEGLEHTSLALRGAIFPIDSLLPGRLEVFRTIHAQVTFEEECYIARFVDANINASGESELDAIETLKDFIAGTFLAFVENENVLGIEPSRQIAVLREFMRSI